LLTARGHEVVTPEIRVDEPGTWVDIRAMCAGRDGAAWITDGGLNAIVRVDPSSLEVKSFPLPASSGYANLNTATFDREGILWFTGQSGIYGRLEPETGAMRVFRAPGGTGPYGITTTPRGDVWYASLAGSHIARIDTTTGQALWASVDAQPDEWTSNFLTAGPERGLLTDCLPQSSRSFLKNKASVALLEAPSVELIDDQHSNETRTVQLRLTSPRGANAISIFFDPDAEIVNASINDKPALSQRPATAKQGWFLIYYALPPEGVVLKL